MRLYELTGYRTLPGMDLVIALIGTGKLGLAKLAVEARARGYRVLGTGSFAMAFQPPAREGSYVIKLWSNDPAYDQVVKVIQKKQSNPNLPKIIWGPIIVNTEHNIQAIGLEELEKIDMESTKYEDFMAVYWACSGRLSAPEWAEKALLRHTRKGSS